MAYKLLAISTFVLIAFWNPKSFATEDNSSASPPVTLSSSDPYVMKVYPDGTKLMVRWSEIGKAVDNGEKYGGPPKIVAYDSQKIPADQFPVTTTGQKEIKLVGAPKYEPPIPMDQQVPLKAFMFAPKSGWPWFKT